MSAVRIKFDNVPIEPFEKAILNTESYSPDAMAAIREFKRLYAKVHIYYPIKRVPAGVLKEVIVHNAENYSIRSNAGVNRIGSVRYQNSLIRDVTKAVASLSNTHSWCLKILLDDYKENNGFNLPEISPNGAKPAIPLLKYTGEKSLIDMFGEDYAEIMRSCRKLSVSVDDGRPLAKDLDTKIRLLLEIERQHEFSNIAVRLDDVLLTLPEKHSVTLALRQDRNLKCKSAQIVFLDEEGVKYKEEPLIGVNLDILLALRDEYKRTLISKTLITGHRQYGINTVGEVGDHDVTYHQWTVFLENSELGESWMDARREHTLNCLVEHAIRNQKIPESSRVRQRTF